MYFSEHGNVDDDATLITIFLVSFNLQSCCLMQSAVCKCHTPTFATGKFVSVFFAYYARLRVVPHFSSGIVERAKRKRA